MKATSDSPLRAHPRSARRPGRPLDDPEPAAEAPADASPGTAELPTSPSPEERRDRIKAAIFFFGAIASMFVLKLLLGY